MKIKPHASSRRRLRPAANAVARAWLALALGGGAAWAKPLLVPFASEYQAEIWDLDDGFPENSCSGIAPAPDGYLWFGTFRGLVRFNGQKFNHWGPSAMPELATTSIINMHRDPKGRLWFSTNEGLVCQDGATWTRWQENDGWRDRADFVRCYADAPDGNVVFSRFGGRVTRRDRDGFNDLPPLPGTGGAWCAFDGDGTLYAARTGFVGVLRDGAWQPLASEPDLAPVALGLGQDREGRALVVCRRTLLRVRGGRIVERVPLTEEVQAYWQLTVDSTGAMWLPALDSGVFRILPSGEVKHFQKADGLPHSAGTRVVHADDAGGIWIGSGVGGLVRLRPKRFRYIGEAEGLGERLVLTVAPLRDGRVLMTTYGAGPSFFDGDRVVHTPALSDANAAYVRTAVRAHDDTVWLGTFAHGLFRLENGAPVPVATGIFGETESINTMFEDSQHRLWIGGEQHVAVGQGGQFREVPFSEELQRRRPTLFAERRDGTVLLTKQHEVYAFTAAGLQAAPLVRLPEAWRISTLLVDQQDRVWIGTTGEGLLVFRGARWWRCPLDFGLPTATISSLVQDAAGKLWFGFGRTIVRADSEELWQDTRAHATESADEKILYGRQSLALLATPGRETAATIQVFDTDDGLRGLDLPYGTQPCVAKDDRGRLWFALVRGAAMIDPATLKLNAVPPPVVIESLSYVPRGESQPVEFQLDAHTPPPVLPAGCRLIRINYAALDFISPRKQLFRVRLGGDRGRWQEMHEDTTVSFLELPPGLHTIQIQASGGDGVWNRTGATLSFELAPFYWQTTWFRGLLVFGFVGFVSGAAWLASQLRVRRARESLARERRFAEVQAALRGLAMKLTESLEAEALGRAVAAASRALFGHDAFLLAIANASGDAGRCAYMEDTIAGEDHPRQIPRRGQLERMSLEPVLGGAPLLINRDGGTPGKEPTGLSPWGFVERRSQSLMFAPVLWNGRVTGSLSVQSYTPRRYGDTELQLLQTLAAHCAAAIARLEAESSLRQNAERLRLAMQSAHMGSWEIDATSGLLLASPEAEEVYGCARDGLAGSVERLAVGVSEPEATELLRRLKDLIAGRATVLDFVHRRVTPVGTELWLELKARLQRDGGEGARVRIIGVTADITARRLAELERNKLEEQLRHSQKLEAVGTLAGGIAHDFNNILTAIIGNAELAHADVGPSHSSREHLDAIKKSGLRARDLVRRILAFSRPREGRRQHVALVPAVEEVVKLLRATIPANIDLKVTAAPSLPIVEIDSTEIHQVLLNLGTNAWHAIGSRPGRIEFVLETCAIADGATKPAPELESGDYARIEVRDNGGGIARDVLPRIFDPFFTTKRPGEGTGLGLSVAHGIMRANGGAITVQSSVGLGSTFTLYLPVSTAAAAVEAVGPVDGAADTKPGRGEHILYIDDESMLVTVVDRLLTRAGYKFTGCTTPHEALEQLLKDPGQFNLVITDYSMPEMNGLEIAEALLRIKPDLPVMLITGYQRPGVVEEARKLGVRAVIDKVDSPNTLLPAVVRVLGGRA